MKSDASSLARDALSLATDASTLARDAVAAANRTGADLVSTVTSTATAWEDPFTALTTDLGLAGALASLRATATELTSLFYNLSSLEAASDTPLLTSGALHPSAFLVLLVAGAAATIASMVSSQSRAKSQAFALGEYDVDPNLPREYDLPALRDYFNQRPVEVLRRSWKILRVGLPVTLGILSDRSRGPETYKKNEAKRARDARIAMEQLGPAFIKVAQAVSTRGDVLSEAYMTEVIRLQDQVEPFSTKEAMAIIRDDFGVKPEEVFAEITPEPVAAASLGQVYRAKLTPAYGGTDVAVKVQRPKVLQTVALDLYVIREACRLVYEAKPEEAPEFAPVIDAWAERFFEEMDYTTEMNNAIRFAADMQELDGIKVPTQFPAITSRRVLVTEWIEGERLVDSSATDVRELCDTLLNSYLIQLLDSGFLHADPHPGNLLRTPDGKICILDYGLMTEVAPDKRYAFVEYIGHLTTGNWNGVAQDLVNLGFAPEGYENLTEVDGFVELIEQVLSILVSGGGADKVLERAEGLNIQAVVAELEEMSKEYKFTIPPYFALILRSFSVIEGIALKVDPDYAIVQECFPYLARRLLMDDSPRMKAALKELLFAGDTRINLSRLRKLSAGFSSFTVDGLDVSRSRPTATLTTTAAASTLTSGPILDKTAVDAAKIIFRKEGSYIADLLVDELAATVNSLSREATLELSRLVLSSAATTASSQVVAALGPLRPLVAPLPLPSELLSRVPVTLSRDDRVAVENVRILWEELQSVLTARTGRARAQLDMIEVQSLMKVLGEVGNLLPMLTPGLQRANERFVSELARKTFERLAEDLQIAE